MWRKSISNFEEKCKRLKTEQPGRHESEIEEEIKANFIEEFAQITPKGGTQILKDSGVLLLPEWDIANAIFFI